MKRVADLCPRADVARKCALLLFLCAIWLCPPPAVAGNERSGNDDILQMIRHSVAANENLATLIRMDYTVTFDLPSNWTQRPSMREPAPTGGRYAEKRSFSRYDATWAQDGPRVHSSTNYFFNDQETPARSYLTVVDGEVMKWAVRPDMMQGAINRSDTFDWTMVGAAVLGFRPFEGRTMLSELLVPERASLHEGTEVLDGRAVYVLDVRGPSNPPYYGKLWIDVERSIPLRIEYYDKPPDLGGARLLSRIDSITAYQLPNGGWIPAAGTRSVYFPTPQPQTVSEHIRVDTRSVTIRREDIPDSLFTLSFPKGARVHNGIVDVTFGPGGDADRILTVDSMDEILRLGGGAEPPPDSRPEAAEKGAGKTPTPPTTIVATASQGDHADRDGSRQTRGYLVLISVGVLALAASCAIVLFILRIIAKRKLQATACSGEKQ